MTTFSGFKHQLGSDKGTFSPCLTCFWSKLCWTQWTDLINQSINQTSIAPISRAKQGSAAQQPNQCSTAKIEETVP